MVRSAARSRRPSPIQCERETLDGSRAFSPNGRVSFYGGKPGGRSDLFEERLVIRRLILWSREEKKDTALRGPEERQCTADILATVIRSRDPCVGAFGRPHRVQDVAFFDDLRLIQVIFKFLRCGVLNNGHQPNSLVSLGIRDKRYASRVAGRLARPEG